MGGHLVINIHKEDLKMNKLKTFTDKANSRYNGLYTYENFIYEGSLKASFITCKIHGDFLQTPRQHLKGTLPCPDCVKHLNKTQSNKNTKLTNKDFIKKCEDVHGNLYDYSSTRYKTNKEPVSILCKEHGEFHLTPAQHIRQGRGCPVCSGSLKSRKEYFLKRALEKHGDSFYTYNIDTFINFNTKLEIICPVHGLFEQTPNRHLNSVGCTECGNSKNNGWSLDSYIKIVDSEFCYLYIIKCTSDTEEFYKIGITKHEDLKKRFRKSKFPYEYEIVKIQKGLVSDIWYLEKHLHKILNNYSYLPSKCFGGATECYSKEVLNELAPLVLSN